MTEQEQNKFITNLSHTNRRNYIKHVKNILERDDISPLMIDDEGVYERYVYVSRKGIFKGTENGWEQISEDIDKTELNQELDSINTRLNATVAGMNVFDTTEDGIAATSDGEYFFVISINDEASLVLWKNNANIAESTNKIIPNFTAMQARGEIDYYEYLSWAVSDEYGNVSIGIDKEGTFFVKKFIVDSTVTIESDQLVEEALFAITDKNSNTPLVVEKNGLNVVNTKFEEIFDTDITLVYAIVDGESNVLFGITDDGATVGMGTETNSVQTSEHTINLKDAITPSYGTINNFLMNGQSLAVAGSTQSTVIDDIDIMFSSGHDASPDDGEQTFVPLSNDIPTDGILMAAIGQLKYLLKNDIQYNNKYKILFSAHGRSGSPINYLNKGSDAYNQGLWQVETAKSLSDAQHDLLEVPCVSFIQGEADANNTADYYKNKLIELKNDYNSDVLARTGQSNRFPMFVYQLCSEYIWQTEGQENEPTSSAGTLAASEEDDEIILVAPTYWISHRENVHFNDYGYTRFGQKWGEVLYRVVYRGETWKPLHPTNVIKINDTMIKIIFYVPDGELVLDDTETINKNPSPANYGFDVRDDNGKATITKIEVAGTNSIVISFDRALGTNPEVSYAWYAIGTKYENATPYDMPRGCLRDTSITKGAYTGEQLHNWCVRFKKQIG